MEQCVQRKSRAYLALAAHDLRAVPGVADFVRRAAEHCRIAVVSGAVGAEIPPGLARAGIADCIDVVLSSDEVTTSKPDPSSYRQALRLLATRHGADAWRAVVVEDSLPGIGAARALGAGCIALTTTHAANALHGADAVWRSFEGHDPAELEPLWRPVTLA